MSSRRKGRESAIQILYSMEVSKFTIEEAQKQFWAENKAEPDEREFAARLACGAASQLPVIDAAIQKHAKNWELVRMAAVDRNILRCAAYELLFCLDIPVNVIINEAVDIAKKFSTSESGKFVNGILDALKAERPPSAAPAEK